MWSIGIWKPIDRKFGLRPWLRKSITTRCGSLFGLGMRLPRKSRNKTRTLHACVDVFWCDLMNYCLMVCKPGCMCVMFVCVLSD